MVNPFGEDDDDFNTNYLIDRDLQAGFDLSANRLCGIVFIFTFILLDVVD